MKDTTLWEVSFECGNKVGGIWTVITSKAAFIHELFQDRYFTIGFYNPKRTEIVEKPVPPFLKKAFTKLEKEGIKFHFGSWVDADSANIILVDSREFEKKNVNKIKGELWKKFELDSLHAKKDFDEPLAWSYAVGMLLKEVAKTRKKNIVQLHEWLSGGTVLCLDGLIPTVFTTHATVLGRATGGFSGNNADFAAKKAKVTAKHLLEKTAAENATVFTTVSEITSEEAHKVLGRKPDILTYNALGFDSIPDLPKLISDKAVFRREIDDFVRAYFFPYYSMNLDDYQVVYTAGRYEFMNKGYDVFIDALGEINNRLKKEKTDKWFLSFILVPTGTLGVKDEVIQNFSVYRRMKEVLKEDAEKISETLYRADLQDKLIEKSVGTMIMDLKQMVSKIETRKGRNPPLSAFQLSYSESQDSIIQRLKKNGLLNRPEDRVKVVFYPVYINRQDELLGLSYREFLTAASMGVFLSRYEPWGYTPMEAAAFLSTTVTTNTAGFGRAAKSLSESKGIFSANFAGNTVEQVADIIENFVGSSKEIRISLEIGAHKAVKENFVWSKLGENYSNAYKKALQHSSTSVRKS